MSRLLSDFHNWCLALHAVTVLVHISEGQINSWQNWLLLNNLLNNIYVLMCLFNL